jgi:hypothetical protein
LAARACACSRWRLRLENRDSWAGGVRLDYCKPRGFMPFGRSAIMRALALTSSS